jgi:hypothetical protein
LVATAGSTLDLSHTTVADPTKDGGTLRTIREACDCMTAMDRQRELRQHWQRACKLILAKADW